MKKFKERFAVLLLPFMATFLFIACGNMANEVADELENNSSNSSFNTVPQDNLTWKEAGYVDIKNEKFKSYYLSGLSKTGRYELKNILTNESILSKHPAGLEISIGAHIGISGKGQINNFSLIWVKETADYLTGFLIYDGSTPQNEGLTGKEPFISDNSRQWMTKIAFTHGSKKNSTKVYYATEWVEVETSWAVTYEKLFRQKCDFEAEFDADFSLENEKNKHTFNFVRALITPYTSSTFNYTVLGNDSYKVEINSRLYPSLIRSDFTKEYAGVVDFEDASPEVKLEDKTYVKDGSWYYDKGLNQCYKDSTNIYEYTPGIIIFGYKEKANTPEGLYYQTGSFARTNGDTVAFSDDGSTLTYKKGEESNTYSVVGQFTISFNKTGDLPLQQAYLLQKDNTFYGFVVEWYTNNDSNTYVNIREPKVLDDKELFKPQDDNLDGSQGTADWTLFGSRVRTFNKAN